MNSEIIPSVAPYRPTRVLIVEDEALVAESLSDGLVDAGFEVVAIVSRLRKALNLVEGSAFDAAIIDANLAGMSAAPLAAALSARKLPYIVLTGYAREQLPSEFCKAPYVQKPYLLSELIRTLRAIFA